MTFRGGRHTHGRLVLLPPTVAQEEDCYHSIALARKQQSVRFSRKGSSRRRGGGRGSGHFLALHQDCKPDRQVELLSMCRATLFGPARGCFTDAYPNTASYMTQIVHVLRGCLLVLHCFLSALGAAHFG